MDERPEDAIATGGQAAAATTANGEQAEGIDSVYVEIRDYENFNQTKPLYYHAANGSRQQLKYDMPFLMWWLPRTGGVYYPVGLWDGQDAMPKDQVSKADIVQWRIRKPDTHHQHPLPDYVYWPLQWRQGTGGWKNVYQRKGSNYYLAVNGSWWMRGVRSVKSYNTPYFAFYMDIEGKGDSWISDETTTGSIRMQDSVSRRAYIVPRHFGTTDDDPFGSATSFSKSTLAGMS
ncbi:hypothetical protein [Nocardia sp. NPDC060259]|uniref:hypothetical protein n=1 Tax=Nocardia sp. NPDC060259 TaxID=3347088 RepID=UPI0036505989